MIEGIDAPAPILEAPPAPPPLGAGRAIWILAVFLLTQLAAAVVILVLAIAFSGPATSSRAALAHAQNIFFVPAALIGTALGALAVLGMSRHNFPGPIASGALRPLGWSIGSRRAVLLSAALGAAIGWLVVYVLIPHIAASPRQSRNPLVRAAMTPGLTRLGLAVAAIVIAPPVEEFLFRGVLFEGFRRSWGPAIAAVLTSALFISLHLLQIDNWGALAGISMLAIATMWVRIATRALGASLALHVAYNLVPILGIYLRGV